MKLWQLSRVWITCLQRKVFLVLPCDMRLDMPTVHKAVPEMNLFDVDLVNPRELGGNLFELRFNLSFHHDRPD